MAAARPPPQKAEAAAGRGDSWFPVTQVPSAAAQERKRSPWPLDHCGAGCVDSCVKFCMILEENAQVTTVAGRSRTAQALAPARALQGAVKPTNKP